MQIKSMLYRQKISPGDFVIGARKWRAPRNFTEPRMVIDVDDHDNILVLTEEGTEWYHISDLERVVQIEST